MLGEELGDAYADRTHVLQILENIITNALQAMPEGGKLTLKGESRRIKSIKYTVISITDTGVGMTDEVKASLFEPLFTTKPRGIGLGLPLCKNLIEINNGRIEVQTSPGKGTIFLVFLPEFVEMGNE